MKEARHPRGVARLVERMHIRCCSLSEGQTKAGLTVQLGSDLSMYCRVPVNETRFLPWFSIHVVFYLFQHVCKITLYVKMQIYFVL